MVGRDPGARRSGRCSPASTSVGQSVSCLVVVLLSLVVVVGGSGVYIVLLALIMSSFVGLLAIINLLSVAVGPDGAHGQHVHQVGGGTRCWLRRVRWLRRRGEGSLLQLHHVVLMSLVDF